MAPKKILILSASASDNYIRIPQALKHAADTSYPDLNITCIDTFKYGSNIIKKFYVDNYVELVKKHPAVWGYMYDKIDQVKKIQKIPEAKFIFQEFFSQKLKDKIAEISPDVIICTHFLPAEQLNKIKDNKLAGKYCSIITDFDVHWLWIQSKIDVFCVATQESAIRLMDRGIPEKRIHVTGIPISSMCTSEECVSHEQAYKEYNLNPDKFKITLLDGGYGIGSSEQVAEELVLYGKRKIQVILYESEKTDKEKLGRLQENYPEDIRVITAAKRIESILAASDLVITSPNGYICSECLAMGVPILSINPMPGNEERNSDYLIENGTAFKVYDLTGLFYRINLLMNNSELKNTVKVNAIKISKPKASLDILKLFID